MSTKIIKEVIYNSNGINLLFNNNNLNNNLNNDLSNNHKKNSKLSNIHINNNHKYVSDYDIPELLDYLHR